MQIWDESFFFFLRWERIVVNIGEGNEVSPNTEKFVQKRIIFFNDATL